MMIPTAKQLILGFAAAGLFAGAGAVGVHAQQPGNQDNRVIGTPPAVTQQQVETQRGAHDSVRDADTHSHDYEQREHTDSPRRDLPEEARKGDRYKTGQPLTKGHSERHEGSVMATPDIDHPETTAVSPPTAQIPVAVEARQVREHLEKARSAYRGDDNMLASRHLNEAIAQLRGIKLDTAGDHAGIQDAIKGLERVEMRLRTGSPDLVSKNELSEAYAETYEALTRFNYDQARVYVDRANNISRDSDRDANVRRDAETTAEGTASDRGLDERAAHYTNQAIETMSYWATETGETVSDASQATFDQLKDWSGDVIAGTGHVTQETGETFDAFGESITDFGHRLDAEDNQPTNL